MTAPVVVYGTGHTSRFVVAELERRGYRVVIAGRDPRKLATLRAAHPDAEARVAAIDDAAALDRALAGGRVTGQAVTFSFDPLEPAGALW